jgi:hypothetical protein
MNLLIIKLIFTPLIIAAATTAVRKWGPSIGGLLIGLPLTSGPISVFLALEQGQAFAAQAARGSVLGLVGVAAFCIAYARSSRRWAWLVSAACGLGAYLAATWLISGFPSGLLPSVLLVLAVLGTAVVLIGSPEAGACSTPAPKWDMPLRMIVATAMLLFITGGAAALGPKWSGLLSPFPIFSFVMVVFIHRQGNAVGVQPLLRGVIIGVFSYAAFFIIVGVLVEKFSLGWVYVLATLATLAVNGLSLTLFIHHKAR